MKTQTIPDTKEARELVVLAYAHSIMEDLVTDCALGGHPLPEATAALNQALAEDLGIRFEETFLQGNAPQWSVGATSNRGVAEAIRAEAITLVNQWLKTHAAQ